MIKIVLSDAAPEGLYYPSTRGVHCLAYAPIYTEVDFRIAKIDITNAYGRSSDALHIVLFNSMERINEFNERMDAIADKAFIKFKSHPDIGVVGATVDVRARKKYVQSIRASRDDYGTMHTSNFKYIASKNHHRPFNDLRFKSITDYKMIKDDLEAKGSFYDLFRMYDLEVRESIGMSQTLLVNGFITPEFANYLRIGFDVRINTLFQPALKQLYGCIENVLIDMGAVGGA